MRPGTKFLHTTALVSTLGLAVASPAFASSYIPYWIGMDPADWIVDRRDPGGLNFHPEFEGREGVLEVVLDASEVHANPFYNYQGYKHAVNIGAGDSFLRGDLWVGQEWETAMEGEYVHTGMWGGVGRNPPDRAVLNYPMIMFSNVGGTGHLAVWDPTLPQDLPVVRGPTADNWVNLNGTDGQIDTAGLINYDGWNTFDIRFLHEEQAIEYIVNGQSVYRWEILPEYQSNEFVELMLNSWNDGESSYSSYWSQLLGGLFISSDGEITDVEGDLLIETGSSGSTTISVAPGATIGGTVIAEGGSEGAAVNFGGSVTMGGVASQNSVLTFSTDSDAVTEINGNVALSNGSSASGGAVDKPIQVTGDVVADETSSLGGNWNITGNLTVAGTLAPGNSIGHVTVDGEHIFSPTAIFEVEINGQGEADSLSVTGTPGTAQLGGTVKVIALDHDGDFIPGHAYTIVSAANGFGGTMFDDDIEMTAPRLFVDPELVYGTNTVDLIIARNGTSFASAAVTGNQAEAAQGADGLAYGNALYDGILRLGDAASARQAFDAIAGEVHATGLVTLAEDGAVFRQASGERLGYVFSSLPEESGLWLEGTGAWGSSNSDGNTASFTRSNTGLMAGLDGYLGNGFHAGFLAGYSRSTLDIADRNSTVTGDNYELGVYAGGQWDDVSLRTGLSQSWNNLSSKRDAVFQGFGETLSADYQARRTQAYGELAYALRSGDLTLEPFAGLAHVHVQRDAYSETGGSAALSGTASTFDATFATLGVRASATFEAGSATVKADGSLGWRHALNASNAQASHSFAGGNAFAVNGASFAQDVLVIGAGVEAALTEHLSAGLKYAGEISAAGHNHGIRGNLNWQF